MKRIHLFEFEDQSWFPDWIRVRMTRMLVVVHKLFGTAPHLAKLIDQSLEKSGATSIVDLCSGGGGPMIDVIDILKEEYGHEDLKLVLSDLYPDHSFAQQINEQNNPKLSYTTSSVDATNIDRNLKGLRTMICSLHHMRPTVAKAILQDAQEAMQPICVYEISDNSVPPTFLWWIGLPFNFIFALFVSPLARPMTWQQIVFTYLIPIIPICFAWDGTVSNTRTYTVSDMDELLEGFDSDNYQWEKGTIKSKGGNKLYLLGMPV